MQKISKNKWDEFHKQLGQTFDLSPEAIALLRILILQDKLTPFSIVEKLSLKIIDRQKEIVLLLKKIKEHEEVIRFVKSSTQERIHEVTSANPL